MLYTNFQMVKNLQKNYGTLAHTKGIVTKEEIELIETELHLSEMDILQLHNMRDFIVLFYNNQKSTVEENEQLRLLDEMSAITAVIDNNIYQKGGQV